MFSNSDIPIIQVQQNGRKAEIVINTGHPLGNGRMWRAYAKVFCPDVYTAGLVSESLGKRLSEAVAAARHKAYHQGYKDALEKEPRQ